MHRIMNFVSLSSLISRGVELQPHEAVAIAQQLIHASADVPLVRPFGPPTLESIVILSDGRVGSRRSAATPAVSEIGRLLDSMLPSGRGKVPGGLRYTVARALLEVDAPPFDSLQALSASLVRFEHGDRWRVVRSLLARADDIAPRLVGAAAAAPLEPAATRGGFAWRASAAVIVAFAVGWLGGRRAPDEPIVPVSTTTVDLAAPAAPVEPPLQAANDGVRPTEMYSPAFSGDGRTIFFHTGGSRAPRSALMKQSGADGTARAVPVVDDGARNYHAQPSPDGRRLAFDSDREGQRGVYVADAGGSNIRRVSGSGYAAVPTWSPTGDRLAFVRAEPDRPKVWNLWLLTMATGELRRLTRFSYGQTWAASWLPDGRRVVFSHEDRLLMLSLSDGRVRSFRTPVPGRIVRTPAVSPDGRRVLFQVWRDGAWLLDLATGDMDRLLADPTAEEFAWSPDGRRFAYHSRAGGRWAIRVASG